MCGNAANGLLDELALIQNRSKLDSRREEYNRGKNCCCRNNYKPCGTKGESEGKRIRLWLHTAAYSSVRLSLIAWRN